MSADGWIVIAAYLCVFGVLAWRTSDIGTRSVLLGAHCFPLHWFFVARGWYQLYGFRRIYIGKGVTGIGFDAPRSPKLVSYTPIYASLWHPALWLAFLVHDVGYIGKPNMDGEEGEQHPRVGAAIMCAVFGEPWGEFVLYHSRFLAKRDGRRASALCFADKLAIALEPRWLYLPRVRATGEIDEYMAKSAQMNATGDAFTIDRSPEAQRAWHAAMVKYILAWIATHKDGQEDTWTAARKAA